MSDRLETLLDPVSPFDSVTAHAKGGFCLQLSWITSQGMRQWMLGNPFFSSSSCTLGLHSRRKSPMPALSTQLRCKQCGTRLPEPVPVECPNCQANLAEVGLWSELLEWGKTRQVGRARFVLTHVGYGGLVALGLSLISFFRGDHLAVYVWWAIFFVIGGYFLGQWYWRAAEREYKAAAERGLIGQVMHQRQDYADAAPGREGAGDRPDD
jgi:hypothetical protein